MPAFTKIHRSLSIASLLGLSLGLSACGYKAPLYYPTQQLQQIEAREQRIKARKEAAKAAARQEKEQTRAREQDPKTRLPE